MSRAKPVLAVEDMPTARYLSFVCKYLTESLFQDIVAATRQRQRQRKWVFFAPVRFSLSLRQSRYASQMRALFEALASSPLSQELQHRRGHEGGTELAQKLPSQ